MSTYLGSKIDGTAPVFNRHPILGFDDIGRKSLGAKWRPHTLVHVKSLGICAAGSFSINASNHSCRIPWPLGNLDKQ